jgi:basic membrane protein A and related proteins
MKRRLSILTAAVLVLSSTVALTASGGGADQLTVGFLYVGPVNDLGFNQAAYTGSLQLKKAFSDVTVLQAENVPETSEAERVMESMIDRGAKLLFPTSFGHLEPALKVGERHPDVTILHLGGLKQSKNVGTYAAQATEGQYLGGIAAGLATKTNKLGYVVAFPIPPSLAMVNAFHLGARSVNPKVTTTIVFTSSWCDPGKQVEAANALLDRKVDVISQHQDCTKTIIQVAERRGAKSVGFHFDASRIAKKGWLTGTTWNWGPLYVRMVKAFRAGTFAQSPFGPGKRYVANMRDGTVQLAPFGRAATPPIRSRVLKAKRAILSRKLKLFTGPIWDQAGKLRVPAGKSLTVREVDQMDYLVKGVTGKIPG